MIMFPGVLLCFRGVVWYFLPVQLDIGGPRGMSISVSVSHCCLVTVCAIEKQAYAVKEFGVVK
jgi:hypothetical protein